MMSRNYDNWERLVEAVLDREKLRQLAREDSFDSITSDFSFDSTPHRQYVSGLEAPKRFPYNELKKATRNFQPVFGDRGFRSEFIGWIDEHNLTAVRPLLGFAVTVMSKPEGFQDHDEWLSKVNYLGQLRHPNLVKLVGYCSAADGQFLVYEFMSGVSLEMKLLKYKFMPRRYDTEMDLSRSSLNQILSWETRVNVAIYVARALSFLHGRKPPVVHGHVKASMILLDKDFNAKLDVFSDELEPHDRYTKAFNRANTLHPNRLSDLRLDYHWPPECVLTGEVTAKTDLYSFGIVLLQLLSGRRAIDRQRIPGERNLVYWAKPHLSDKRKLFSIMDPKLRNQYSNKGARMLAAIAFQCLSPDPGLRPSMTIVLAALERAAQM